MHFIEKRIPQEEYYLRWAVEADDRQTARYLSSPGIVLRIYCESRNLRANKTW